MTKKSGGGRTIKAKAHAVRRAGPRTNRLLKPRPGKEATASASMGIRFDGDGSFRLVLPNVHVRLVSSAHGPSPPLPIPCDVCGRPIESYPFIAKHYRSYRKYHVACALSTGVILPLDFGRNTAGISLMPQT
jgi:hypothetical protein